VRGRRADLESPAVSYRRTAMGSFSVWHWLIVLLIVVLIFGTKKLKNIGSDLGSAVKGFKDGVRDGTASPADPAAPTQRVATDRPPDPGTVDVETKTTRSCPRRAARAGPRRHDRFRLRQAGAHQRRRPRRHRPREA